MQAGRTLQALRTFHGLSLSQTARRLGFAKSFISDIERNQKAPSLDTLQRYAEMFDIPVASIIILAESNEPDSPSLKIRIKKVVARKALQIMEYMSPKADDDAASQGEGT